MIRFAVGALVGIAAALALGMAWDAWRRHADPCLARCGAGTICQKEACVVPPPPVAAAAPAKSKKGGRRRATDGTPTVQLQPGDTRIASEGDDVKRPSTKLDLVSDDGAPSDLDQDQLDAVFNRRRDDLSQCLVSSVGDAPLDPGARLTVSFRVEPSGEVKRVRVEAPQLMLRNHIYACVRPLVTAMRFPRATGATLASYPFELK